MCTTHFFILAAMRLAAIAVGARARGPADAGHAPAPAAAAAAAVPAAVPAAATDSDDVDALTYVYGIPSSDAPFVCVCERVRAAFSCEDVFETAISGRALAGASQSDVLDAFVECSDPEVRDDLLVGKDVEPTVLGGTIHPQTTMPRNRLGLIATNNLYTRRRLSDAAPTYDQFPAPTHLAFLHEKQRESCSIWPSDSACSFPSETYRYSSTGRGVTIYMTGGVVDTRNVDFIDRRVRQDFSLVGATPVDALDPCAEWYSTHYAALVVGVIHGAAKDATFVSAPVTTGCLRPIPVRDVLRGLQWVLDDVRARTEAEMGPSILLMAQSLREGIDATASVRALEDLVASLLDANVTVMAYAGARSVDACTYSPGRMPGVITVGALDVASPLTGPKMPSLVRPWFLSNYGPCVDLWAPGTFVESASNGRDGTAVMSGTFQATAVAAGVAAIILEKSPHLDPAALKSELLASASGDLLVTNRRDTTSLVVQSPQIGGV